MDDPPPASARTPQRSEPVGRQALWWRRLGWLLAGVWLVFLVQPVLDAARDPHRGRGAVAIASLVAFAVYYLRPWLPTRHAPARGPLGFATFQQMPRRRAVADLLVLASLTALAVPGAGPSALSALVFVSTYAMFSLPLAWAAPLAVTVVGGAAIAGWILPGWGDLMGVAQGGAFAVVGVFGITRMVARSEQLALAHQDLARLAVVEERDRVARDLHDLLGHSLTVVTLKAELAGRLLDADPADPAGAAAEVADVERLARDALADVRAALAGYREVSLGAELAGARSALAAAGIEAHLPGAVDDVPAAHRELFGWVVREGVTNVIRHSGARRCWVELSPEAVAVCDDGTGPCPGAGGGSGLSGLADRVRAAGGTLTVGRSGAGGFDLRVQSSGARADREDPRPLPPPSAPSVVVASSPPARVR